MDYHDAWLTLIDQRDQVYLWLFIAAAVGMMWYRFLFNRYYWAALAVYQSLIVGALVWGGLQLAG